MILSWCLNSYAQKTSFLGSLLMSKKTCDDIGVKLNIEDLQKINNTTIQNDPSVCFSDRDAQYKRDFTSSLKAFRSDVAVCECLAVKEKLDHPDKDFSLKASEALVSLQNARTKAFRNDLVFQASIIAPQVQSVYVRSRDTTVDTGDKINISIQEKRNDRIFRASPGADVVKLHEFFGVVDKKQKNPNYDENLFIKQDKKKGQCIESREYLAFNTIPKSDDFFNSLRSMNTENFNEKDWDFDELGATIGLEKDKSKREEIKARLRFLSRNPLIRNLFSVNKNDLAESGASPERTEEVNINPAWAQLPSFKKDLFKIIKTLSPDMNCTQDSGRGCLDKISNSQKIAEYRKQLGVFFGANSNPHMADLLVWENERKIIKEMVDPFYLKNNDSKWMNFPRSQRSLDQFLQSSEGLSTKGCYGFDIVKNHEVDPKKLNSCLNTFSKYCPFLQVAVSQNSSDNSTKAESEFDESEENYAWVSDLEADIDKNDKMKDFNDAVCNTKRKMDPNKKPAGMRLSDSLTFNEFKIEYCKNKCPENSSLLSEYLNMYPQLSDSSVDIDTEIEIKAFASYIKDNSAVKPIEKSDYNEMATTKVSTTDRVTSVSRSSERLRKLNEFADALAGVANSNGSTDSSSGGFFDSLKNILPSFSTPESADNSASGYNSYQGVTATTAGTEAKATEISSKMSDENDEENELKEKLSDTQEQLRNAKHQNEKQELKDRMAMLEQRLKDLKDKDKDKDEAIAKYQKMIDTIKNNSTADNSQDDTNSARSKRAPGSAGEDAAQTATNNKSQNNNQNNQVTGSSSATQNDNNSVSSNKAASTSFGSHSSAPSDRSKSNSLNDVLLAKYGIVVDGKENGQVILGKDKEPKDLMKLEVATKTGQGLELKNVSLDVYSGFESKNDETLKSYVKMVESMPAQVVKVSVSTPGRSQVLQFYAIKESGKVVFQPIRTASLKNLKSELEGRQ